MLSTSMWHHDRKVISWFPSTLTTRNKDRYAEEMGKEAEQNLSSNDIGDGEKSQTLSPNN